MSGAGPILLHIGLPKTGTTYLQSLVWEAHDALRAAGLLVPGFGPRQHLWASCVVRQEPRLTRRHPDAPHAWDRLVAELDGWSGTGLISHEFLCGASEEQAAAAVADLTRTTGREVHVVVTGREIVSLVTARWQEWVKNGATGRIDAYPPREEHRPADEWGWGTLDLAAILERWSGAVPPERIHLICPAEPGAPPATLWRRFAGVVGVPEDVLDPAAVAANPSLGLTQVELLRRLNASLGDFHTPLDRGRWIRGYLAQDKLAGLAAVADEETGRPEPFWPGPERVAALRARGEAGLERIAAGGYDVVGSLDLLRTPAELPERRHPSDVAPRDLLALSGRLVASLLADVREADEAERAARSGGADDDSGPGGVRAGFRRAARLWHDRRPGPP